MTRLDIKLEPGKYRLVVPPVEVDARMVARLRPVAAAPTPEGHGPHPLVFGVGPEFPVARTAGQGCATHARRWTFALAGEFDVHLTITEGMVGEIIRGDKESVGRFVGFASLSGKLAAGAIASRRARSAATTVWTTRCRCRRSEMQPDVPRFVGAAGKLDFAIAEDRVVNLTTFGRTDLRGVLKDANGAIVERLAGRSDDWNIALSRKLAAGHYTLAPERDDRGRRGGRRHRSSDDDQAEVDVGREGRRSREPEQPAEKGVESPLRSPEGDRPPAIAGGRRRIGRRSAGPSIHAAARRKPARCKVASRASAAELVLSVETRDAPDAHWRVVGFERGPVGPCSPGRSDKSDKAQWRASVWSIDGASVADLHCRARRDWAETQDAGVGDIAASSARRQ